jgi:zinc transporter 1
MTLSRTTRILILLVIDILFFIVEITVGKHFSAGVPLDFLTGFLCPGYIIGSLALVADSFHMLKSVQ